MASDLFRPDTIPRRRPILVSYSRLLFPSCHTTRRVTTRSESPLSTLHSQPLQHRRSTSHLPPRPRAEAHTPEHARGTPARQHEPARLSALASVRLSALASVRQHDSASSSAWQPSARQRELQRMAAVSKTARAPAYASHHSATLVVVPHHCSHRHPTPDTRHPPNPFGRLIATLLAFVTTTSAASSPPSSPHPPKLCDNTCLSPFDNGGQQFIRQQLLPRWAR
eukprot:scaffold99295_cov67-Phaeocystis_antarctica.AAC.1